MQISRKLETFSQFFIAFLKSPLNFEYFEKKDQSHSLSITEVSNCKAGSYFNAQNAIFQTALRQATC